MKDNIKIFARNVRTVREEQGLSQEALGKKAKIHRTYIGGIERGERNPSLKNMGKIAQALHTELSKLLESHPQ